MTMIPREQALELALLHSKVVEQRLHLKLAQQQYQEVFVAVCRAYELDPEEWTIHAHSNDPTVVHLVHASSMPPDHPLAKAYAAKQTAKTIAAMETTNAPPLGDFDREHPEGGADLEDETPPDTEGE
jgi:hypothetical protein